MGTSMVHVTFQVLEGVDRGRIFRELSIPLTIGREEGNLLRLNDERVSRFHAKIQQDNGDIILTDLESTNGTRVNGAMVQIRRLRPGDRIGIGRSVLIFGSSEEIEARLAASTTRSPTLLPAVSGMRTVTSECDQEEELELDPRGEITINDQGELFLGTVPLPPLPQKLTPSQVARLAEILEFLHHGMCQATENIRADDDCAQVTLGFGDWQRVQLVQMLLARYLRALSEPE